MRIKNKMNEDYGVGMRVIKIMKQGAKTEYGGVSDEGKKWKYRKVEIHLGSKECMDGSNSQVS